MKIKFEWEEAKTSGKDGYITQRAKVIRGWVLLHREFLENNTEVNSMIFIPDKDHEWIVF